MAAPIYCLVLVGKTGEMVVKTNNSSPWISLFQGEEHAAYPIATWRALKGKV